MRAEFLLRFTKTSSKIINNSEIEKFRSNYSPSKHKSLESLRSFYKFGESIYLEWFIIVPAEQRSTGDCLFKISHEIVAQDFENKALVQEYFTFNWNLIYDKNRIGKIAIFSKTAEVFLDFHGECWAHLIFTFKTVAETREFTSCDNGRNRSISIQIKYSRGRLSCWATPQQLW